MLYWLLSNYGHDRNNPESKNYNQRLQRIHFYSLTYHIMVNGIYLKFNIFLFKRLVKAQIGRIWRQV